MTKSSKLYHFLYQIDRLVHVDTLIIYLDELVMEISLDIFLFFWMEKKLILSSHISRNEFMGLILCLSSVLLNGDDVSA